MGDISFKLGSGFCNGFVIIIILFFDSFCLTNILTVQGYREDTDRRANIAVRKEAHPNLFTMIYGVSLTPLVKPLGQTFLSFSEAEV